MKEIDFEERERQFVVQGFQFGFPLEYKGPQERQQLLKNLKLRCGVKLWDKVMKEVKLGRYAGPFDTVPYKNFIQSPIGLMPKHEPRETWLIFHLSYPEGDSVNFHMSKELCSV